MHDSLKAVALAAALGLAGLPAAAALPDGAGPIPGPRDCFWRMGPHGADPYINTAYPDAGAYYWAANFTVPAGARLELQGEFAHARYQSFISYDERGQPVESLADYLIEPEAGSVNPYRPGADRHAVARRYTVEVITGKRGDRLQEGEYLDGHSRNLLHAPQYAPGQQTLIYRIYVPNLGLDVDGGVGLPRPVLTLASGERLEGAAACQALKASQRPRISPDAVALTMAQYRTILDQPGQPYAWPATVPLTWHVQMDRKALLGIYTGEVSEATRRSEGGFYPNPDNNYVRTIVNRKHGKVLVLRGKMPTTPKTHDADPLMGQGQLRYWSLCSNQGFVNTRVNDCVYDEQVPLDQDGFYTIVLSRAADRPRNAIAECGIAWLPMADDGDGAVDEDVTVVQIRNMLASPDFAQAIQRVEPGMEQQIMGPYLPRAFYTMPNVVETLFPCLP